MEKQEFLNNYLVDRKGTNSLKWDALKERFGDPNLTSMWVADTEFKTSEYIREAMKERIDHGVYGYSFISDDYYEAVIEWNKKYYGADLKKEEIRLGYGIVGEIYWLINAFTNEGDAVIIQTPVYYPFHNAVKDNNRKLICSPLVNTNGKYTIDYAAFEKDIVDNDVKLFIQCSPHNPVGRVWTEEELDKVLAICKKHNVLVLSDEIHQDIIVGDRKFIPTNSVSNGKYRDIIITMNSTSKSFNLASLLHSHTFIYNEDIRKKYDAFAKRFNQIELNILGLAATKAAYTKGRPWLDALVNVVKDNYTYLRTELNKEVPEVIVTDLEGTYLTWIDLRKMVALDDVKKFTQEYCNLAVDYGEWFAEDTKGFIRINLATDPEIVKTAVKSLIDNLKGWSNK